MIVGDTSVLAIESGITLAYERLSFRALGFFVLHVGGRSYGIHEPDATMLACTYDEVERRIARRGSHCVPFSTERDPGKIADTFREAVYADEPKDSYFGIPLSQFIDMVHVNRIDWARDRDEAFDDGSYVLQFDVQDRVRVVAFRSFFEGYLHDPNTISDIWLAADDFYRILQCWHDAFRAEWETLPKVPIRSEGRH